MPSTIDIADRSTRPHPFNPEALRPLVLRLAVEMLGDRTIELSITLVSDRAMRGLNLKHRGIDRTTDVLSFPLGESRHLGDIVISSAKCLKQAAAWGWTPSERLAQLTIHGFLHLLGYDHHEEAERIAMEALEERLFGIVEAEGLIGSLAS